MEALLDVHVRGVKIKSFLIHMLSRCIFYKKRFMEKYLCWFTPVKSYVLYETIVKKMAKSISSSNNVYEVVDDNNNHCKSMMMNAMRMNQDYADECSIMIKNQMQTQLSFFDF